MCRKTVDTAVKKADLKKGRCLREKNGGRGKKKEKDQETGVRTTMLTTYRKTVKRSETSI